MSIDLVRKESHLSPPCNQNKFFFSSIELENVDIPAKLYTKHADLMENIPIH